jgi:hypothetical protein
LAKIILIAEDDSGNKEMKLLLLCKNLGTGFKPISKSKTMLIPIRETVGPTGTVGSLLWIYNHLKIPNSYGLT